MTDEIKEILDNLFWYRHETVKYQPEDILTIEDIWLLYDYITTLQEENKEIKNTIDFIDNKYKSTISYNEKLIEYNQDYKSRIDKALYWLSENTHYTSLKTDMLVQDENANFLELKDILQGDDNNANTTN